MKLANSLMILGIIFSMLVSGCVQQTNHPSSSSSPSCTPNWQCTEWSACESSLMGGVQKRACTDSNSCNIATGKPAESQVCTIPKLATKEPSEMALQLSDLPSNYSISERTERVKSDVSEDAINLGWQGGYYIRFLRMGAQGLFDVTTIEQSLSIYPLENVSKVITLPMESNNESIVYEELSKPNIGENSRAWRIDTKDQLGIEHRYYQIEFIKMNVYTSLYMGGTATDYELLKDIANKAEVKIG